MGRIFSLAVFSMAGAFLLMLPGCGGIIFNSDTTGPKVVTTSPARNEADVSADTLITVTFDEQIDAASLNSSTFYLDNGATGEVTYNSEKRQAIFTPSSSLRSSTTYSVTLTRGITDRFWNSFGGYTWSFTTG